MKRSLPRLRVIFGAAESDLHAEILLRKEKARCGERS